VARVCCAEPRNTACRDKLITLGYSAGDVALAHLAKVIKSIVRSTDVLARYGGEEFIIILPGTNESDAIEIIKGVQRDLTKYFFLNNNERVLIAFSAGVAERFADEMVDEVMSRVDTALYQAKQTGRNQVVGASAPTQMPVKKALNGQRWSRK
jgi:diguanylate cyclase